MNYPNNRQWLINGNPRGRALAATDFKYNEAAPGILEAGDVHRATPHNFSNLPNNRAHRTRGSRDNYRITRLWKTNPQQTKVCRQARAS